jgi:hypothetical protein
MKMSSAAAVVAAALWADAQPAGITVAVDRPGEAAPDFTGAKESELAISTPQFDHIFPPYSLTVLRLEIRK